MTNGPRRADYDAAFDVVIQRRWQDTPTHERDTAEAGDRQGQLKPNAPDAFALRDVRSYQRGHADVFREAYRDAPHRPPGQGERLLVVDIGAGAATVAVAIGEALDTSARRRVDYRAFDPHPMMRRLGKRLLQHLDVGFRSATYVKALDKIDFGPASRVLFTFSYVSHQDEVTPGDVQAWSALVQSALANPSRETELIYTTANLSGGKLVGLADSLDAAGVGIARSGLTVAVRRCFPQTDTVDGRVQWNEQATMWQVKAEHWKLTR